MLLIDANVWIKATHKQATDHDRYYQWLANVYSASVAYAVTDLVAAAFLRITTNPKAFRIPFTMHQAILAWDDIASRSMCAWIHPGKMHWAHFCKLSDAAAIHANLVNDAWLAALALEYDCQLISADSDFQRFPGLRWQHPLAATS